MDPSAFGNVAFPNYCLPSLNFVQALVAIEHLGVKDMVKAQITHYSG